MDRTTLLIGNQIMTIVEQGNGWYRDSTGKVTYTTNDARLYWQEIRGCEPTSVSRLEEAFKRLDAEESKLFNG
jgi:hypothetical protein